jgi:arsenite methyltransferase
VASDDQLRFDEQTITRLERMYRTPDVLRRRSLAGEALAPRPAEHVLDVGCGPGFFLLDVLQTVGSRGAVTGIDSSSQMLAVARDRCEGHANASFHEGDATALPVEDEAFEAALTVQVLEYVDDVPRALSELYRVVKPGGRVVVWDTDWATVTWHSSDADRMQRVLAAWDGHLTHPSLPRVLAAQLRAAGWSDVGVAAHPFTNTALTPDVISASLMGLITDFVAPRLGAAVTDAWAADLRELGERDEYFFSYTQFCFTARKPSAI